MNETELTTPTRLDSGVPWIGTIPSHWEMVRAKYLFDLHKDIVGSNHEDFKRLSLTMQGVLPRDKTAADGLQPTDFAGYQIVQSGDLIFKLIDLANVATSRVGLAEESGLVSPVYICVSPSQKVHTRFYYWFFMGMYFREIFNTLGNGVRSALNAKDLLNLSIPLPPLAEQQRIAAYLDRETAKIDALIAEYKGFLEILKRRDQALIAECVTKGVPARRAGRKMKNSGVEWIGEIPEEWAHIRIGSLFKRMKRTGFPTLPLLSIYREHGVVPKASRQDNHNVESEDLSPYQLVNKNDLVINKMKAWQGSVAVSGFSGIISPAYFVYEATSTDYPQYLHFTLRASHYTEQYKRISSGVRPGQWDLDPMAFKALPLMKPDYSEQVEIAEYLEGRLTVSKALEEEVSGALETLQKYRNAIVEKEIS